MGRLRVSFRWQVNGLAILFDRWDNLIPVRTYPSGKGHVLVILFSDHRLSGEMQTVR